MVGKRGLECDPVKIEDFRSWPVPDCLKSVRQFFGVCRLLPAVYTKFCQHCNSHGGLDGEGCPICLGLFDSFLHSA